MKDRKVATRYARALLSLLPDPAQAAAADAFLGSLSQAMDASDEVRDLMLDPAVSRTARTRALRALAESAAQTQVVANFLATVVDRNRMGSLPSIAAVFHEEWEKASGVVAATLTSAVPLDDELRRRARAALEKSTGRTVQMTYEVDPDVIGGAVTQVGSKVFDGSLRTQLARLRQRMAQE